MPKICLFCNNKAGNREHLWGRWIHARKDFGPLKKDSYQLGRTIIPNPEITVKSICAKCNNGWMSDLETKNIPTIGSMFSDLSLTLDRTQQEMIAAWTIKTSIMLDSMRPEGPGARFYCKQDCVAMRKSLTMPEHTTVWIGRIDSKHLVAFGIDHRHSHPDTFEPCVRSNVTTIVAGHFVVQSITRRKFAKFVLLDMPILKPKGENGALISPRCGR